MATAKDYAIALTKESFNPQDREYTSSIGNLLYFIDKVYLLECEAYLHKAYAIFRPKCIGNGRVPILIKVFMAEDNCRIFMEQGLTSLAVNVDGKTVVQVLSELDEIVKSLTKSKLSILTKFMTLNGFSGNSEEGFRIAYTPSFIANIYLDSCTIDNIKTGKKQIIDVGWQNCSSIVHLQEEIQVSIKKVRGVIR